MALPNVAVNTTGQHIALLFISHVGRVSNSRVFCTSSCNCASAGQLGTSNLSPADCLCFGRTVQHRKGGLKIIQEGN